MRQVKIKTPGTCGEFIQGWFDNNPCLVSSPIDRYSTICIKEGPGNSQTLKSKSCGIVNEIFNRYQISQKEKEHIFISMETDIPLEKGMASSTADLAGMALGLSSYFNLNLSMNDIGKLCTKIEPSDNLMFKELNLFNHINGEVLRKFEGFVEADLLIIDFYGGIDTLTFNETQDDYSKKDLDVFFEIVMLFDKGLKNNDLKAIGEACTRSAFLNQKRLKKTYLEKITTLGKKHGSLGTIIGHSGTVIGLMYQKECFQKEAFFDEFKRVIPKNAYLNIYNNRLIPGGSDITVEEFKS